MTKKRAKTPRTKVSRARVAKKSRTRSTRPTRKPIAFDPLDAYIEAAARALALPLEPDWRPAVKTNLDVTLRLAAAFADFPLPDDAEPAPVFVA
jgi:hypothetical protein